jgi:hypothetical protein
VSQPKPKKKDETMKNKFLLIFCSAALLTVMNTSYASSLPSTSSGRSQIGDRKIAGGGKLCQGKFTSTYANYIARYSNDYTVDRLPVLTIYFSDAGKELSEGDAGTAEVILVNGRSILDDNHTSRGAFSISNYRFKGGNRVYRIKGGDKVKAIFFHAQGEKDTIECTVPYKY